MKADTANGLALIDAMIALLRQSMAALDEALRLAGDLSSEVERGIENPVQQPLKTSETRAEHRRAHRRGVPSKIDSDPELRAFIIARNDRLKFAEIADEVRASFPPDRHTSRSSLSRWWIREGQHLAAQSQDTG